MAFQLKDFASLSASLINYLKSVTTKVTDFNQGSVVRTMLEAPAAEIEELYLNMFIGLKEAIPVSVFTTFGFDALAANAASGIVRFSTGGPLSTVNILIPVGTIVKVPATGHTYLTQAAAVLPIGSSYVDVLVAAQTAGVDGNTSAGTITELAASISGIASVTNPGPFTNGRDAETDDERRIRFQGYIKTLARGTKAAVEYGAKTAYLSSADGTITEYVAYANVVEPWVTDNTQPISLVRCYIHNGASATSSDLVTRAQSVIDGYYDATGTAIPGWKAAGVQCIVSAASDAPTNVTGVITLANGADSATVIAAATVAVQNYIQGLTVGADVLKSELVAIIMRDVEGVFNVSLTTPSSDVAIAANAKATPGVITLTTA